MAGNSVGQINLNLGINTQGFRQQINSIAPQASSMVGSAFKKIGLFAGLALGGAALTGFAMGSIKIASDLQEVQNVVDVTFGDMAESINSFSKSALLNFGMSELSAKKFTSTMGAMLKSSGLTGAQMTDMSKNIAGLTGDMASFYNLKHQEAFDKIRAGLAGETEPLRALGINMSVANLEAYALSKGINKSFQSMSQAEQVILRYNYVLNATKDAQGDFARTSGSWANQTRVLSEQWNTLKGTMGAGFINLLNPILKGLNSLILKLQTAVLYFKAFTDAVFGNSNEVAKGMQKATSGAISTANANEGLAGKMKDLSKAAKGSISGFDEVNTLAESVADVGGAGLDNTNAAVGGVSGGGSGDGLNMPDIDTSAIDKAKLAAEGLVLKLKELWAVILDNKDEIIAALSGLSMGFLAFKVATSWGAITAAVSTFVGWIGTGLATALAIITAPLTWIILAVVALTTAFVYFYRTNETFRGIVDGAILAIWEALKLVGSFLLDVFMVAWNGLVAVLKFLWYSILVPIATFLTSVFLFAWDKITKAVLWLYLNVFTPFMAFLKSFYDNVLVPLGKILSEVLAIAFDNVSKIVKSFWEHVLVPLGDFISTVFMGVIKILSSILGFLWRNIFKPFGEFLKNVFIWVLERVGDAWSWMWENVLKPVGKWISDTFIPIWEAFGKAVTKLWDEILKPWVLYLSGIFVGVFDTVYKAIDKAITGMKDLFNKVVDWITDTFSADWSKAWENISKLIGDIFWGMVDIVKAPFNILIELINTLFKNLNKLPKIKIPGIPGVTKDTEVGFNLPMIPKLARGGIISQPTLAMMGERGKKEAVVPLENTAFVDTLASAVANAVMSAMQFNQVSQVNNDKKEVVLQVDSTKLARVMVDAMNRENRRIGNLVIQEVSL